MNLTTREMGKWTVVQLAGEVDLHRSSELRHVLMGLMGARRPVVVDLAEVDYIDSSGIASLVEAYQAARTDGGRLVLASVSQAAMRVLRLARLDRVFTIADTVQAAAQS